MKIRYIAVILAAILFTGCNKFLDIRPTGMVIARTGEDYRALLTEKYLRVPCDRSRTDLRTNDVKVDFSTTTGLNYYNYYFDMWSWNDYNKLENAEGCHWIDYYEVLYISNYIIEHKNEIEEASVDEINQLVGESYMMRAYMHFLLVNIYSPAYTKCNPSSSRGIPLQLRADIRDVLRCSSVEQVYRQIMEDIDMAEGYMNVEKWGEGYTYRFSKITANALRARVALYMGNWQLAFDEAKKVIAKYPDLVDLKSSSTMPNNYESVESILALEIEDSNFKVDKDGNGFVWLSDDMLELYGVDLSLTSFKDKKIVAEFIDLRILSGNFTRIGTNGKFYDYDSGKYQFSLKPKGRNSNDYRCTFRASEFYLIASEAANELGNISEATQYLKELMKRRFESKSYDKKVQLIDAMSQDELRTEILNERHREFVLQGHNWFDLRRTTQPQLTKEYIVDGNILGTYVLEENDSRYTMPIPTAAVAANPELEIWPY